MAKLSFTNDDKTHSTEWKHEDLTLEDIFDSLVGLLTAATFLPKNIIKGMYKYSNEQLDAEDKEEIRLGNI